VITDNVLEALADAEPVEPVAAAPTDTVGVKVIGLLTNERFIGGAGFIFKLTGEEYVEPELFDAIITTWSPLYERGDKLVNVAVLEVCEEGVIEYPFLVNVYVSVPAPPNQDRLNADELIDVADKLIGFVGGMESVTGEEDTVTLAALVPVMTIWSPSCKLSPENVAECKLDVAADNGTLETPSLIRVNE